MLPAKQISWRFVADSVLTGCDDRQSFGVLAELVAQLKNPYPPRE